MRKTVQLHFKENNDTLSDLQYDSTLEVVNVKSFDLRVGDIVKVEGKIEYVNAKKVFRCERLEVMTSNIAINPVNKSLSNSANNSLDNLQNKTLPDKIISLEDQFIESGIEISRKTPNVDIEYVKELLPELYKHQELKILLFKVINGVPDFTLRNNKKLIRLYNGKTHSILSSEPEDGEIMSIADKPFKFRFVPK